MGTLTDSTPANQLVCFPHTIVTSITFAVSKHASAIVEKPMRRYEPGCPSTGQRMRAEMKRLVPSLSLIMGKEHGYTLITLVNLAPVKSALRDYQPAEELILCGVNDSRTESG
jgi:hypothetical protein